MVCFNSLSFEYEAMYNFYSSLPLVSISRNLSLMFVRKIG